MSPRLIFSALILLIVTAIAFMIRSLVLGVEESASAVIGEVSSLVSAMATLVAAVTGLRREGGRSTKSEPAEPDRTRGEPAGATRDPADGHGRNETQESEQRPFTLSRSFEAGVYGGLIGGAIAGVVVGVSYAAQAGSTIAIAEFSTVRLVLEITVAAMLFGGLMGAATQFGAYWFRHLRELGRTPVAFFNEAVGGALLGFLAGSVAGAMVGITFAPRPLPAIDPVLLIGAAIIGAITIPGGALLYDFRGRTRLLVRAFLLCFLATGAFLVPAGLLIVHLDVIHLVFTGKMMFYVLAGAIFGGMLSAAVGCEVGATLQLHRLWLATERRATVEASVDDR